MEDLFPISSLPMGKTEFTAAIDPIDFDNLKRDVELYHCTLEKI